LSAKRPLIPLGGARLSGKWELGTGQTLESGVDVERYVIL